MEDWRRGKQELLCEDLPSLGFPNLDKIAHKAPEQEKIALRKIRNKLDKKPIIDDEEAEEYLKYVEDELYSSGGNGCGDVYRCLRSLREKYGTEVYDAVLDQMEEITYRKLSRSVLKIISAMVKASNDSSREKFLFLLKQVLTGKLGDEFIKMADKKGKDKLYFTYKKADTEEVKGRGIKGKVTEQLFNAWEAITEFAQQLDEEKLKKIIH